VKESLWDLDGRFSPNAEGNQRDTFELLIDRSINSFRPAHADATDVGFRSDAVVPAKWDKVRVTRVN